MQTPEMRGKMGTTKNSRNVNNIYGFITGGNSFHFPAATFWQNFGAEGMIDLLRVVNCGVAAKRMLIYCTMYFISLKSVLYLYTWSVHFNAL